MLIYGVGAAALAGAAVLLWALRYFVRVRARSIAWKNIPGPPARSWFFGHLGDLFGPLSLPFHLSLLNTYGNIVKLKGPFGDQLLYTCDPLVLQHVVLKDQDAYEEQDFFISSNKLVFGEGLIGTRGEQHRKQRKMLQPVFSVSQMRRMIPTFYGVVHQLRDKLLDDAKDGVKEVDLLNLMARSALEIVGQSGLGYSFDVFESGKVNAFTEALKKLASSLGTLFGILAVFPWLPSIGFKSFRRSFVNIVPNKHVQNLKNVADVMDMVSRQIYQSKLDAINQGDGALLQQIGEGTDIMSVLLKANMQSEENRLTDEELIAQMSVLVFAATDTTSSALSRAFFLLTEHPDVQERLRKEVCNARKDGDIPYDDLDKLPFLDAIIRETLRLYPPAPLLGRVAQRDTVLPISMSAKEAEFAEELVVTKGSYIVTSVLGANRSKEIWGEDADEWKPDRWLDREPLASDRPHLPGVYSNLMTFFGGGRACMGFRFALMEMKVVLSVLLESLAFSPSGEVITWKFEGIDSPWVEGSEVPELPMKVTVVSS